MPVQQHIAPQLQSVKSVPIARSSPPIQAQSPASAIPVATQSPTITVVTTPDSDSSTIVIDDDVPPVTLSPSPLVQEQVVQSGMQNKVQARLTAIQQQQILQTLKQKVLPVQQTVAGSQYKAIAKQKPVAVQLAKQQPVPGTSLLTHAKNVVPGEFTILIFFLLNDNMNHLNNKQSKTPHASL